ncbi:MAG TPA: AraC family transcriptional regulator [Verrucomicrobiae bacterium]|jgi:AraC-like DNA-binding protein
MVKTIEHKNKLAHFFEPHLTLKIVSVSSGEEWIPKTHGWSLVQVQSGNGYWLQEQSSLELEAGTTLLMTENVRGRVRASQLCDVSLSHFQVIPSRLTGLITSGEQDFFRQTALQDEHDLQIFPAGHPVSVKLIKAVQVPAGLPSRLALLQVFIEAFGKEWKPEPPRKDNADAKERLRVFLKDNPPDTLLEISFSELAKATHCTPRHLSRIFCELTGMSFRDKRAEIRLARARELLATSKSKVVEVALESGYKSLSLFNLMFTRRFGTSPGRWRQKNRIDSLDNRRGNARQTAAL